MVKNIMISAVPIDCIETTRIVKHEDKDFVRRCVKSLVANGWSKYQCEYCFTEQQAIAVLNKLNKMTNLKNGKYVASYKYNAEYDMYIIELKRNYFHTSKEYKKLKNINGFDLKYIE